jgi:hypothetical protein
MTPAMILHCQVDIPVRSMEHHLVTDQLQVTVIEDIRNAQDTFVQHEQIEFHLFLTTTIHTLVEEMTVAM